jgi:hypothetical protein
LKTCSSRRHRVDDKEGEGPPKDLVREGGGREGGREGRREGGREGGKEGWREGPLWARFVS